MSGAASAFSRTATAASGLGSLMFRSYYQQKKAHEALESQNTWNICSNSLGPRAAAGWCKLSIKFVLANVARSNDGIQRHS